MLLRMTAYVPFLGPTRVKERSDTHKLSSNFNKHIMTHMRWCHIPSHVCTLTYTHTHTFPHTTCTLVCTNTYTIMFSKLVFVCLFCFSRQGFSV